jgi:3-isopropylmalate/(R)-2-methylmalate dehydratase small subunit
MGRAFVFGDDINTDILAPGRWMRLPPAGLAAHCLEDVDPSFAGAVRAGDFVVAGRNFGMGSSREQAAVSLKILGVSAILATSFARIFYRNAINVGLPTLVYPAAASVRDGDELLVDPVSGRVENRTQRTLGAATPLPPHLMEMVREGGLIPHLKARFAGKASA